MRYLIYMHGGSGNHGCEALARTIGKVVSRNAEATLFSKRPNEDSMYIGNDMFDIVSCGAIPPKSSITGFISAVKMKFFHEDFAYVKPAYHSLLTRAGSDTVALSIGGDNYCYDGMPELMARLNCLLNKKGAKTVLLGCSVEPQLLQNPDVVADMRNYTLITARESITYDAMLEAGLGEKVKLVPDSAFLLETQKKALPQGFLENNTVGLNLSPLVLDHAKSKEKVVEACCRLIEYILHTSDMNIALIPHVVWSANDDRKVLSLFYEKYKNTGRVVMVDDCSAPELKGYIASCRFFIGARTHATIAAYSSCVPTIVVGYSVKSKGIAKDLFGTCEHYVLPIDNIDSAEKMIVEMKWLQSNEMRIQEHLQKIMHEYKKSAMEIDTLLRRI